MTVYEFLLHAARSYSGVVNGGKTEEIRIDLTRKSIWSGRLPIMREGKLLLKSVRLENGELCKLEGLIDFEGDAYAEIERLYAQFKRSVPNRHVRLNKGYFKALSSDALTMEELMDNMPRPEARMALEEICRLENITVSEEEIDNAYAEVSQKYGMTAQQLRDTFGTGNDEKLRKDICMKKAISFLENNAQITVE